MTFILNILHRDMSILAADQKAISGLSASGMSNGTASAVSSSIVNDYRKITLNSGRSLAVAIAGNTQDHFYMPEIPLSVSINEALSKIRRNMESILRVNDRASLSKLTDFMVNQSIATFFDQDEGTYFSNEFMFSPVHNQTRLHRPADGVTILHAGSGSEYFKKSEGRECIEEFTSSAKVSCTLEACLSWLKDTYRKVSANDFNSGPEAMIFVSTRLDQKFHSIERC